MNLALSAGFDPDVVVAFVEETLRPEAIIVHELARDVRSTTSGRRVIAQS